MPNLKLNQQVIIPSLGLKGKIIKFENDSHWIQVKTKNDVITISKKLITIYSLIKWIIVIVKFLFKK